jgi:uncharacterized protein YdeI (YjbR/CyaY-like superfamily)
MESLRTLPDHGSQTGQHLTMKDDLPVMSFQDASALREWLAANHRASIGLWVRIFNSRAGVPGVTFEDLLEQGLCFGWSESKRMRGDETFYLQRFTPRRRRGTTSDRNKRIVQRLLAEGKMTESGLEALEMAPAADRQ